MDGGTGGLVAADAKSGRPSWARVHLAYATLAAMSVLTLGLGLWASEQARRQVRQTAAFVNEIEALRKQASTLHDHAVRLASGARRVTSAAENASYIATFEDVSRAFDTANAADFSSRFVQADVASGPSPRGRVSPLMRPSDGAAFDELQGQARAAKLDVVKSVEAAVTFSHAGNQALAREYAEQSLSSSEKLIEITASMERLLSTQILSLSTTGSGDVTSERPYTYILYALIAAIVGLLTAYARQVAHALHAGYILLADSDNAARLSAAEQQEINEQITNLNVSLAQKMKELSEAQEEIIRRGRLSQLGQLIATVAHEVRNPLGAVKTGVFVLERRLKAEVANLLQALDASEVGDAKVAAVAGKLDFDVQFQRINRGVTRCDAIITQLLDFTRTAIAQTEMRDLDAWLRDVLEEQRQQLPPAVAVEFIPGLSSGSVAFDPARMQRVIVNLVNNASEAMVGKGDDLSKYTTMSPRIVVATRSAERGIEISVSDNGPGIQPEDLKRVLEPLFTTKSFGTGIGLAAVEKILEQHKGGLGIASEPGKGACFTAWFPNQASIKEAV